MGEYDSTERFAAADLPAPLALRAIMVRQAGRQQSDLFGRSGSVEGSIATTLSVLREYPTRLPALSLSFTTGSLFLSASRVGVAIMPTQPQRPHLPSQTKVVSTP